MLYNIYFYIVYVKETNNNHQINIRNVEYCSKSFLIGRRVNKILKYSNTQNENNNIVIIEKYYNVYSFHNGCGLSMVIGPMYVNLMYTYNYIC